jgi:hypothetical protein
LDQVEGTLGGQVARQQQTHFVLKNKKTHLIAAKCKQADISMDEGKKPTGFKVKPTATESDYFTTGPREQQSN